MQAISNYHPPLIEGPGFGYDFTQLGELIYEIDESAAYEEDEAKLLKKGETYTLIQATGCSCWDGDWEGWTDLTPPELKQLAVTWLKGYGAEKVMGAYINENL